jgi:hypothetical protein
VEKEIMLTVQELGYLALAITLAITLAGSNVAATPRLRSDIRSYLPEYRERRRQLLGMKARKLIHRYGESVLSTWETSFVAVERQSAMAARLLGLLAFLNFNDIIPALFGRFAGEIKMTEGVSEASDRRWQAYLSLDSLPDPYTVEEAFEVLQTYSLIQWRDEPGGYAMHKLVHAWGQDRLEVERHERVRTSSEEPIPCRHMGIRITSCPAVVHAPVRRLVNKLPRPFLVMGLSGKGTRKVSRR